MIISNSLSRPRVELPTLLSGLISRLYRLLFDYNDNLVDRASNLETRSLYVTVLDEDTRAVDMDRKTVCEIAVQDSKWRASHTTYLWKDYASSLPDIRVITPFTIYGSRLTAT
jgi:hypothetical protein